MSTTSSKTIQIQFSGDIAFNEPFSSLDNASSPAKTDLVTLAIGANTITAPVVTGIVVTGLLIIPPAANINLITLKGITGDTGVALHKTDPTSLALDTTFVSLVLTVTVQVVGVRLVWS